MNDPRLRTKPTVLALYPDISLVVFGIALGLLFLVLPAEESDVIYRIGLVVFAAVVIVFAVVRLSGTVKRRRQRFVAWDNRYLYFGERPGRVNWSLPIEQMSWYKFSDLPNALVIGLRSGGRISVQLSDYREGGKAKAALAEAMESTVAALHRGTVDAELDSRLAPKSAWVLMLAAWAPSIVVVLLLSITTSLSGFATGGSEPSFISVVSGLGSVLLLTLAVGFGIWVWRHTRRLLVGTDGGNLLFRSPGGLRSMQLPISEVVAVRTRGRGEVYRIYFRHGRSVRLSLVGYGSKHRAGEALRELLPMAGH